MSDDSHPVRDDFEFVTVGPDVELGVQRAGAGPAVLLLGGLGMPCLTWHISGLPAALADNGFEVISYNARGQQPSSAPPAPYAMADLADDAAAILDHHGIRDAILVGYSMGCYTAQLLQRRRPELARAMVLFAGLQPTPMGALVDEMELALIERLGEVPRNVLVFEQLMTSLSPAMLQDPATVRGWHAVMSSGDGGWTSPEGFKGQLMASHEWITAAEPTSDHLAAIDVPTLVLAFEHDLFFPPALCEATAQAIPGAEFVRIDGAGHGGVFTAPGDSAQRIVDFCRTHRPN